MRRLAVSRLLARPWLNRSTVTKGIGCSGAHYDIDSRGDGSSIGAPISDRMQVLPTMLVQSYSAADKGHCYSRRGGDLVATRNQGHHPLQACRRGLQGYAPPQNALNLKPCVVIYDGVCHLCNAGVNWIIKVDKKKAISFCALQSRTAEPYLLLCGVSQEDVLRRFVFVEGPDSWYQASTAALKVASHLPLPYSALSILMVIPEPIRDVVYDYVANRRYQWFGKSTECISPTDDVLDRFVDKLEIQQRMAEDDGRDEEPAESEKF